MTDYDRLILILRRATGISKEIAELVESAYDDVLSEIDLDDSFSKNKAAISEIFSDVNLTAEFESRLVVLGQTTVAAHADLKPIKVTKKLVMDSLNHVMPESNISTSELISRTQGLAKSSVTNYTKQAMDGGWTKRELTRALMASKRTVERHISTIAVTSVNAVSNEARLKLYNANSDLIDRVLFVATLDSKTSNICIALDGKTFKLKDAPILPLHPNERSSLISIKKGQNVDEYKKELLPRPAVETKSEKMYDKLGLTTRTGKTRSPSKTDRSPLKGTQTYSENYEVWLKKQPKYYQQGIIGKKATAKFRAGASLKDVIKISPVTQGFLDKALK